ncbi:MAG: hypothetical protein COY53_08115 [Elusimicrobia bacterium CG_4_10_14_0_8_um_filter_37_32]|nr:MAG: hypothetical protein COY53_08115 [Elusimicrobia bacterium CG_4_10_14_0_8_um_filter_37_32]
MEIIDTHVHLNEIENVNQVLERARHSVVSGIVAVGVDYESNKKNLQLHTKFNDFNIYIAMGVHPSNYNLENFQPTIDFIKENTPNIVAIGEIGLDYVTIH